MVLINSVDFFFYVYTHDFDHKKCSGYQIYKKFIIETVSTLVL